MQAVGILLTATLLATGGWFSLFQGEPAEFAAPLHSVALMTFRASPEDPTAGVLASGLPEDLSSALSATGVQVASRSSVLQFGEQADPRTLGAELGVNAVLVGSVRSYGSKFKIASPILHPSIPND